ncbi:MAG: IPT/TIG domain-containing protein, partial [Sulfurifustaceae bacterium]
MARKFASRRGIAIKSNAGLPPSSGRRSGCYKAAFVAFLWFVACAVGYGGERLIYDDLNRLIGSVDEAGTQTTYTYDPAGNILSVGSSTSPTQLPSISSLTPASGVLGSSVSVTIAGVNLTGAALATDNSGIAIHGVTVTATTVKATFSIGNDVRLGNTIVTLTTLGGSTTANFSVVATNPALTSLSPASGPVTRLVDIAGNGFASDPAQNQVSFNGTPAGVLSVSSNKITTQVPSGATSGDVVVMSRGLASNPLPFLVETAAGPAPSVTNISPNVGSTDGGVLITVSGSGFVPGTTVRIGGKALSGLIVQDPNTVTGIVPPATAPGLADVIVSNANGDVFLRGAFSYLAGGPEEIVQLDPAPGAISPTNSRVTLLFARPVDRTTINSSTVAILDGTAPVAGSYSFSL